MSSITERPPEASKRSVRTPTAAYRALIRASRPSDGESRPTDSESPIWATDLHDVWSSMDAGLGAGSDCTVAVRRVVVGVCSVRRGAVVPVVGLVVGPVVVRVTGRVVVGAGRVSTGGGADAPGSGDVEGGDSAMAVGGTDTATAMVTAANKARRVRTARVLAIAGRVATGSGRMAAMRTTTEHVLTALNTATASANKIHDDDVARQYGFRGGLVPGVDVYAYLTHVPVREWGRPWLEHGTATVRLVTPVYDGHTVKVTGTWAGDDDHELDLAVTDGAATCASGRAGRDPQPSDRPEPPAAELPPDPPPASPKVLRPGTVLGSVTDTFDAAAHRAYLADVRETLALYADDGIAHPGWVLRFANQALSRNVVLGPWIHVSSEIALLGAVQDGERVEARSVVLDEFERKGHRFVTLDVAISTDGRPVQRVTHTAIHTPRRAS